MTLFVCALFLFWILIDLVRTRRGTKMQFDAIRQRVGSLGLYSIAIVVFVAFLHAAFNLGDLFVQIVGRDLTFTGRTEIWELVLREKTNPLIGVGFYSFWLGDRPERLSEGYYYHLNEAHNGYLETYLNNGLIGLALLAMVLISAARRIKPYVLAGQNYGALRLAFLITTIIYGMTEAVFNRLVIIWFVLLLSSMEYPRRGRRTVERTPRLVGAERDRFRDHDAAVDAPIQDSELNTRISTAQIPYSTV